MSSPIPSTTRRSMRKRSLPLRPAHGRPELISNQAEVFSKAVAVSGQMVPSQLLMTAMTFGAILAPRPLACWLQDGEPDEVAPIIV